MTQHLWITSDHNETWYDVSPYPKEQHECKKSGVFTLKMACLGQGHENDRFFAFFSRRFQPGISTVCPRIATILRRISLSWSWVVDPHAYEKSASNSQSLRIYDAIHHLYPIRNTQIFSDFDHLETLLSFCRYFYEIWPVNLMTWLT